MPTVRPIYDKEEFARRGDEMYERQIAPNLTPNQNGQFAAIDIETGEFETDADEMIASARLTARVPNAQIWLRRIGSSYTRRFGGPKVPRT